MYAVFHPAFAPLKPQYQLPKDTIVELLSLLVSSVDLPHTHSCQAMANVDTFVTTNDLSMDADQLKHKPKTNPSKNTSGTKRPEEWTDGCSFAGYVNCE